VGGTRDKKTLSTWEGEGGAKVSKRWVEKIGINKRRLGERTGGVELDRRGKHTVTEWCSEVRD